MSEQTQRRLKPGEAEIAACCSGNHSQVTSWSWGPDVCLCVCDWSQLAGRHRDR